MATLREELLNSLLDLNDDQFKLFKFYVRDNGVLEGRPRMPLENVDKADRPDMVDLMLRKYLDHGALEITLKVLGKINRNDLVERLKNFSSRPGVAETKAHPTTNHPIDLAPGNSEEGKILDSFQGLARIAGALFKGIISSDIGPGTKEFQRRQAKPLKWVQQFAKEVTFDHKTAHPNLILSDDGKQVHHGDLRKKLPDNPERFYSCVNVLGKQSFSTGRVYFEVQVKGKTAWALGVTKESIKRKGGITASPNNGYWTIMLRNGDEYEANDENPVSLSLTQEPQKIGVFVDYDDGLVSFYNVDSADHLYSFIGCSFNEKLYPFFTPCTNDGGVNSAPLIITPIKHDEGYKRQKAKLKSVQQFEVEVTFDHKTAHPALILSDNRKEVYCGDVYKKLPDSRERFNSCVNVLGKQSFSTGKFYFEVQVKGKTAWTVGVAKEQIDRKGDITVRPRYGFWTMCLTDGDEYKAIDDQLINLSPKSCLQKVGVFVDYDEGLVSFYDVDCADLLYSFTNCSFKEKLYPFFSPCTNDGGVNSAPLVISTVKHLLNPKTQNLDTFSQNDYETKKANLSMIQQFEVEVTLDPETAHPALFLSDDRKEVHDGDVWKKLPENLKRFKRCVNVLGKQSFSSGKFYYEVQVKGKTAWTVGVAKESIDRKGDIALRPRYGFWTVGLRNGDEYMAVDDPVVDLSPKSCLQKVGVFVDYDEGLVSFYNVDTADHLYSFTDCSFTDKLYPYFSPCTNEGGVNSAPLIISPVKHDEGYKMKKAKLKSVQQFEVDVTFDHKTAHPSLILSEDGKQVHHGDIRKKLPDNPERFYRCVNVLGKQSISLGKFYYEVQVKGKTAWTVGVAKESIDRKGDIALRPRYGFWTVWLRNGDEYTANDDNLVSLSLNQNPQRIGVFVDYDDGLVSFYDVDSADLLYSFTNCSFNEKLYPFFSPCTNGDGVNSAPLIISPVKHLLNPKTQTLDTFGQNDYETKKANLLRIQQFGVEVTLDPETAHPALFLSDDRKEVHDGDVWKKLPENPKRFKRCVNVLGKQSFSSGKFYFEVQVKGKTAWTVGVAKESIDRKGDITVRPRYGFWTVWLRNGDEYTANDDNLVSLSLNQNPQRIGVFVDYDEGLVSFYNVDSADLLYSFTNCSFTDKLFPFFSPCTHEGGVNSAPLIITPVDPDEYERKKAELKSVQQFGVDVTLDPDTAHPALVLSEDGKQVYCGTKRQKLPDSRDRFNSCVNVLGKQSFSSGRFYFEVQVKGKTAWTLGVAKESINRRGKIKVNPYDGYWTIWLRNGEEYMANDDDSVRLSVYHHLEKVGVFVDYDDGLISFYDVDSADLLYSFTGCSFTEKLLPYISPCSDDNGSNSAPLVICPVNQND